MLCWPCLLALALAATAQRAPIRPLRWHFNPPTWTNDPSLLYTPATGLFHNFFQAPQSATPYAPWAPQGGGPVWRHATTPDFSAFTDHGPINLTKNEGTGSLAMVNATYAVRAFAGLGGTSIGGAADAQAAAWVDLPPFPRVPPPPPSAPAVNAFSGDPFLYYDEQFSEWVLLVAACNGGTDWRSCVTPRLRKYAAADVVAGAFAPIAEAYFTGPEGGTRPECPRAWRFSPQLALLAWSSPPLGRSLWFLGSATRAAFTSAASGLLDGGAFYAATLSPVPSAPRSFTGEAALLVGWVHDARPVDPAVPWYNTMSAPRYLRAAQDGLRVQQAPAPLLLQQRGALLWGGNVTGRGGAGNFSLLPPGASGASLWVEAQLVAWHASCAPAAAAAAAAVGPSSWGLALLASPDAQEATLLSIANGTALIADSTRGSLDPAMGKAVYTAAASPASPGLRAVTALVDVSLVEAFAHSDIEGEAVVSIRSYPTRLDSGRVAVLASPPSGAQGFCVSVWVYTMP